MTPRTLAAGLALCGLGLALSGLPGCSSTPPYEAPALAVPPAFKESAPDLAGTALWRLVDPQASRVPDAWWTLFADPVLDGLQARVVVDNQNLQASLAQVRAAQAALASAHAGLLPTLNAGFSGSRAASTGTNSSGQAVNSPATTTYNLNTSASWEIDLWGRLDATASAADARLQASRLDLDALRLSTQATLAQSYLGLRAAEAQAATLERAVAAYQRSLALTRNRYQAGVAAAADVAQAESQLASAQAQLVEQRSQRAQLEHAIAVLLGQPPAAFGLAPTGVLPALPPVPELLPSTLLQRRPDIAAAERRVAAANAQVGVAQAAFFPSLTLSATAGYRGNSLADLASAPHLFWSLGPALALSLFDGGARRAATEQARAGLDQASASYRQTVLTAFQEVEDNLVLAASLREQARLQGEALAAARRALEIALNQYQAGTVSYLNVATAQAGALSAERSLLDVQNRQLAATGLLLKNLAGRWPG